jgi:hypothetical protein
MNIREIVGPLALSISGLVGAADATAQQPGDLKLVSNKATANEVRVDGRSATELASRVRATTSEVYENRLQEIIDRATKAGVLKSKEDFNTTLIQAGKTNTQPNEKAYNAYLDDLKSRTRIAFSDSPENLSAILSTIYRAQNGESSSGFKGKGIRTDQVDKLLNHHDLRESYKAVKFITTGILNNVAPSELVNGIDEILSRELLASK